MKLNKFVSSKARPLPVIIMADISGSMSINGKIEALNQSIQDMISSFATESRMRAEIHLSIVTFGKNVQEHIKLAPAHQVSIDQPLVAEGTTPLGEACRLVKELLEDKEMIPSRAYRPVVVLASDGYPTDDYQAAFNDLIQSERGQKATRLALAIGNDADEELLSAFNNDLEAPLFYAHNASEISRFFRAVTMSVAAHSQSQSPNQRMTLSLNSIESVDDEDFELPL
ncbi:vWA domain-containing protein [Vibrio alginolyticus]|uniref:vWA domain-containing protein n=1 Tax=Vibrio alginolyticus TaxID=663 RepID=UPI0037514DA6|nr:VWA domain-containing protein [Vibrio vulnificus]EJO9875017.1 VWA domain-containing protein [Vibrio vulnificus]